MRLRLLPDELAVCTLAASAPLPEWATGVAFFAVTRTARELSIVCPAACVPEGITAEASWRTFEVAGPLDFSQIGILAAVANPLAAARVSIFAISTYYTDYLLVRSGQVDEAVTALRRAGHHCVLP